MNHAAAFSFAYPPYVERLPCAKSAWPDVTSVLDSSRRTVQENRSGIELELRFGHKTPQGFEPGVSQAAFQALETRFDTGRDWARVDDWVNVHSYMHPDITGQKELRTEIIYNQVTSPTTIQKQKLVTHDYRITSLAAVASTSTIDMRLAVAHEIPVGDAEIPQETVPTAVHMKERKCYYYAPTGYDTPVWCYMLTKRWSGPTMAAVLATRHSGQAPVYEIELECVYPPYLLSKEPGQIAMKLLYKACDMLELIEPSLRDRASFLIEPSTTNMLWVRK
jgi:hypothetical protein